MDGIMQGGGEEEEREATTAKDSHNVTEKRGMKKKKQHCLTSLPLECIQYILWVWVYVRVWHAGRKAFSI